MENLKDMSDCDLMELRLRLVFTDHNFFDFDGVTYETDKLFDEVNKVLKERDII